MKNLRIFPAYAGVNLGEQSCLKVSWNLPRVCGGEPVYECECDYLMTSSPRMRG